MKKSRRGATNTPDRKSHQVEGCAEDIKSLRKGSNTKESNADILKNIIPALQENDQILFSLNKKRADEINELRDELRERVDRLEVEFRAYLLDRAEKGDISKVRKFEVEKEGGVV